MLPTVAKARLREIDPLGDRHAQVRRHAVDLGVNGVVAPAARDEISGLKVAHAIANRDHDPGGGIPQRRRLAEAGTNGLDRLGETVAARLLEHLLDLVRPRPRLSEQALARRFDLRSLRPGAQEARAHVHDEGRRRQQRGRNVENLDLPSRNRCVTCFTRPPPREGARPARARPGTSAATARSSGAPTAAARSRRRPLR